jgi:uncharacterized membrane protein
LAIFHLLSPRLEPVDELVSSTRTSVSLGTLVGFGFVGVVFGSFFGWLIGLISRVAGPSLFKYLMLGALVGAIIGVIGSVIINSSTARSKKQGPAA